MNVRLSGAARLPFAATRNNSGRTRQCRASMFFRTEMMTAHEQQQGDRWEDKPEDGAEEAS